MDNENVEKQYIKHRCSRNTWNGRVWCAQCTFNAKSTNDFEFSIRKTEKYIHSILRCTEISLVSLKRSIDWDFVSFRKKTYLSVSSLRRTCRQCEIVDLSWFCVYNAHSRFKIPRILLYTHEWQFRLRLNTQKKICEQNKWWKLFFVDSFTVLVKIKTWLSHAKNCLKFFGFGNVFCFHKNLE